jgi:uncharacterized damage-inducible protein DinB
MSIGISLDELLRYSHYERAKWREWVTADPARLTMPFQPVGRFPTVGSLLDHIFLVEKRHLSRLQGIKPPAATGVQAGDAAALFAYGDAVREEFRGYAVSLPDPDAEMVLDIPLGVFRFTRRKLAIHIVQHEIRHLAQIAYAVRVAGEEPPGMHDLVFCPEVA